MTWAWPITVASLVLIWIAMHEVLFKTLQDFRALAPAIRIYPGAVLGPFTIAVAVILIVAVPMKAIPVWKSFTDRMGSVLNVIALLGGIALIVVMPAISVSQHYFTPHFGYSQCTELQGNPTMWFTDWVRNPAWCVSGKTREWVAEQGRQRSDH